MESFARGLLNAALYMGIATLMILIFNGIDFNVNYKSPYLNALTFAVIYGIGYWFGHRDGRVDK